MKTFWLTGLPASGKTTLGSFLKDSLVNLGHHVVFIDGDEVRRTLCKDLGFSKEDRSENIRRVASMAKIINDSGCCVVCCFVSPTNSLRALARNIIGQSNFIEIFIDATLEVCKNRDPKGLYKKAERGEIVDFTGVSAPYETPSDPNIYIKNDLVSIDESCALLIKKVTELINQ